VRFLFPVIDDSPGGFLFEWWSIFFDVYAFRQLEPQYAEAEGLVKVRIYRI